MTHTHFETRDILYWLCGLLHLWMIESLLLLGCHIFVLVKNKSVMVKLA